MIRMIKHNNTSEAMTSGYENMFSGCTSSHVTPPALPATVSCHQEMFSGCTSPVTPPLLPGDGV